MSRTDRHNQARGATGAAGASPAELLARGPVVIELPVGSVAAARAETAAPSDAVSAQAPSPVIASSSVVDAMRAYRVVRCLRGTDDAPAPTSNPALARLTDWRSADALIAEAKTTGIRVLCTLRHVNEAVARQALCRVRRGDAGGLPTGAAKEITRAHGFHVLGRGEPSPICGEETTRCLAMRWVLSAGACERVRDALKPEQCRIVPLEALTQESPECVEHFAFLGAGTNTLERLRSLVRPGKSVWKRVLDERALSILRSMTGEVLIELGFERSPRAKPPARAAEDAH